MEELLEHDLNVAPAGAIEAPYRLAIEPVGARVRVRIAGQTVVDSTDARVMHETYLPSHIYFPKDDLIADLLVPSSFRTFCPFKGTAHHWHLHVAGRTIENGAWSYENALPDAGDVSGFVAFYPHLVEELLSDQSLPDSDNTQVASGALINWLLRAAWKCQTPTELSEQFAEHLLAVGLPLWRFSVSIWTLHPELQGRRYTWVRGGSVEENDIPYGILESPAYLNSPVRHVSEGLGGVRQRLDITTPEFQFPILDELRASGGTDYVAMPLPYSDGQIQTMTLASDDPAGFTTAHLGKVYECVTVLSRFYEVLTLRRNTDDLFDTYLGRRTRRQVLGGLTHRGDGEDIRAAILFCDMRNSTGLAEELSPEIYLDLLNDFFERTAEPVLERGGEVLKFIGDAVLAIFPLDAGATDEAAAVKACQLARETAEEIVARIAAMPARADRPTVQCALGLHFGDVMYGNVGAPKRLDFTVIGRAANVAARLSAQCKALGQSLLMSAEVANRTPDDLHSLGNQRLHHVAESVEVFTVGGANYG
ncbi:MAG: DUF427 domain-containing protein [Proteobacteria bacterium]|nr:DUF427 domain-containing protein [Pseudomonadota bacterium]MDA1354698.1 DUF427 domain-containing protein [Pseudomonadota bacterium]